MCGIFGYASLHPPETIPAWRAVFKAIAYRGPDAQGLYLAPAVAQATYPEPHSPEVPADSAGLLHDPTLPESILGQHWPAGPAVLLGHLRLAIIDLQAASDQPLLRGSLVLS